MLTLLSLLLPHATLLSSLSSALQKNSAADATARIATVAGIGTTADAAAELLGAPPSVNKAALVEETTSLAIYRADDTPANAAAALAASNVVLLEMSQSSLVDDGPLGLSQLAPLLQRALALQPGASPQKRLLVLTVKRDGAVESDADLLALAQRKLAKIWSRLVKPSQLSEASLDDALEVQLCVLPSAVYEPAEHASALAALKDRFLSPGSKGYFFGEGRWSCTAAASLATVRALEGASPSAAPQPSLASEALLARACTLASERATRHFQKGLGALRKDAESTVLADFGERATALLEEALARFDADAAELQHAAAAAEISAARAALERQLSRALQLTARRQLALLQLSQRDKFLQLLAAIKPSLKVEAELKALLKRVGSDFEDKAKGVLPSCVGLSSTYEKRALELAASEAAKAQMDIWRLQGLYIPMSSAKIPVDFSAHWLQMNPFGADPRFDAAGARDKPKFRPQAYPIKLRARNGYKAQGLTDPKSMVFVDGKTPAA